MPFIQEIKRTNENKSFSFKVEFQLGTDLSGKPISRTEVWAAPEGLSKNEALPSIQDSRSIGKAFKELVSRLKMKCNKKKSCSKKQLFFILSLICINLIASVRMLFQNKYPYVFTLVLRLR